MPEVSGQIHECRRRWDKCMDVGVRGGRRAGQEARSAQLAQCLSFGVGNELSDLECYKVDATW
jgi:hypothetical protein